MPDLTIRGIPSDIMEKVKILSRTERRSINNEMLLIIENGLRNHIAKNETGNNPILSKDTQLELWENLSGNWEDKRSTEDIINDIYSKRTKGRDVEL